MAKKVTPFWEGYMFALSELNFSHSMIVKKCAANGLMVSKAGVGKILRRCKQQSPEQRGRPVIERRNRPQPGRNPALVRSVRTEVVKENPPTQRSLAARKGVSQRTIGRIIHENLGLRRHHKPRGHKLTDKHIAERKTNARKLYENHLAGDRWQWVVSLDEAWVRLDDTNKPRVIYYRHKDAKGRSDFVSQCKEKFSKGFMVAAAYGARGQLCLHRIDGKAKVNAAYFQEHVMERLYSQDIPRLYGTDSTKVWIHMDKASSHTAKSSARHYETKKAETGIGVIPFTSIPVMSPDTSPLYFCAFDLLKRGLSRRRPKTLDGL